MGLWVLGSFLGSLWLLTGRRTGAPQRKSVQRVPGYCEEESVGVWADLASRAPPGLGLYS